MKKLVVFSPLAAFLGYAVCHLSSSAGRPFLLRWIDVSMAFMFALVATLLLKKLLLGNHDDGQDGGGL